MPDQRPLVSVILLCYRNAGRIKPSINSVLQQDYPALEIVIADDGSPDFNEDDLRQYLEKERTPNLRNYIILHSQTNQGTVGNLRAALAAYTGDFYLNMGADDRLTDNSVISDYIDTFEIYGPQTLLVSGQMAMANEECTRVLSHALSNEDIAVLAARDPKRLFSRLSHRCLPATVATCFRREFEAAVQGRDPAYRYSEDHHTFQRMARKGITPVYINRVTAYHPAGGVANGGNIYNPQIQERFREDKLRMWKQEIYPFWHNILPEDRKLHRKRLKLDQDNYILSSRFRSRKGKFQKIPAMLAHPLLGILHLNDVTLGTRNRSIAGFMKIFADLVPSFLLSVILLYAVHFASVLPHALQSIAEVLLLCIAVLYGVPLLGLLMVLGWYNLARWRFRKIHN